MITILRIKFDKKLKIFFFGFKNSSYEKNIINIGNEALELRLLIVNNYQFRAIYIPLRGTKII